MKKIGISQRVENIKAIGETRDCLDQRWSGLLYSLGFIPIPLPNTSPSEVRELFAAIELDAIILSGGNDLSKFAPNSPSVSELRDNFEKRLIDTALEHSIPVLGICRGMQVLNTYFGGAISPIEGHAGTRHEITNIDTNMFRFPMEVNSFHDWCIPKEKLGDGLVPLATDRSENVEAMISDKMRIGGLMWHPEREVKLNEFDADFMKVVLN